MKFGYLTCGIFDKRLLYLTGVVHAITASPLLGVLMNTFRRLAAAAVLTSTLATGVAMSVAPAANAQAGGGMTTHKIWCCEG